MSSVDLITKAGQSKVDGASGVGFEYALQQALSFGLASPKFGAARAAMTWAGYLKIPNSRARGFFSGCQPTLCSFQTSKDITNVLENSENYFWKQHLLYANIWEFPQLRQMCVIFE